MHITPLAQQLLTEAWEKDPMHGGENLTQVLIDAIYKLTDRYFSTLEHTVCAGCQRRAKNCCQIGRGKQWCRVCCPDHGIKKMLPQSAEQWTRMHKEDADAAEIKTQIIECLQDNPTQQVISRKTRAIKLYRDLMGVQKVGLYEAKVYVEALMGELDNAPMVAEEFCTKMIRNGASKTITIDKLRADPYNMKSQAAHLFYAGILNQIRR